MLPHRFFWAPQTLPPLQPPRPPFFPEGEPRKDSGSGEKVILVLFLKASRESPVLRTPKALHQSSLGTVNSLLCWLEWGHWLHPALPAGRKQWCLMWEAGVERGTWDDASAKRADGTNSKSLKFESEARQTSIPAWRQTHCPYSVFLFYSA